MEKENVEEIMKEYRSKLAEINNETEIKRQQLHIDRLKEEQESIDDKKLYLEYITKIEKEQKYLESLKLKKEAYKKDFEDYVKNNRLEITQKLISKQKEIENEIEEYEIKFQSQMHILKNFKYEKDENGRVTNGNEFKDIFKISDSISKHLNQLRKDKIKCEEYIVEIKEPLESEKEKFKTINSILNRTYGEEELTKQTKKSEDNKSTKLGTSEPKDDKQKDDNQTKSDDKKDNEKIEPKDDKPTKPELTEQEKREMVESYLALEEKNLKSYIKLRDCLQHACEFKEKDNNIAGKMSLENARNYEKNIEKYEKQLLEMAEKVNSYLNQEDIDKLIEYGNKKNAMFREIREMKEKMLNIGTQEQSNSKPIEKYDETTKNDTESTKPNNEENKKDINNLHFYTDLKKLKDIEPIITYTIDNKGDYNKINYKESTKWKTIREKLKNVYPEINFESEEGQQELQKYENADPNFVSILSNNKNRLEEYIELLNGEKQIDVNNKDALKITYDIRTLSKSELSKEEKKALEDYAFKHRNIAEVKKTPLQAIKFKFREMKEKRENAKATKALNSGEIITSPVKDEISSETKEALVQMVDDKNKRAENINSMNQYILSDEEKQKMKEERDKKIKENIQRQAEETINWQIENISKKIANAKNDDERARYENELKQKIKEKEELNKTRIDNNKNLEKDNNNTKSENNKQKEKTEPEKPETSDKQKDVSKNKFEENAKKQNDDFIKNTANWKNSFKVTETTKPIETTIAEQEDLSSNELIKLLDKRIKAREKLNDLQKGDKNIKIYELMIETTDKKISEIHQKYLSESIDVKKDIVRQIKQSKNNLEDKIVSMPEGRNKEIYKESIEIMNNNIQELENIISTDIKELRKNLPDKREER